MELHSYAKRRTLKKWTIEQKRKLVEARINYDAWFTNKPSSMVPWKNILVVANLDDFNAFFVRKQWSNMLARYKQYKQTYLGSNNASNAINAELIKRINQEWEFFERIHTFMTLKNTNLHSYALRHRTDNNDGDQEKKGDGLEEQALINIGQEQQHSKNETNKTFTKFLNNETITIDLPKDCVNGNIPNNVTISVQSNNILQEDGIHLFSSDTNDEFKIIGEETTRTTSVTKDHKLGEDEFCSKKSLLPEIRIEANCNEEDDLQEQQSNYFADDSEESLGSLNTSADLIKIHHTINPVTSLKEKTANEIKFISENMIYSKSLNFKRKPQNEEFANDKPSTSSPKNLPNDITKPRASPKAQLSECDKYYRHKKRFNRRLEKRFDAFLQVMGQIVKVKYPTVDITPLVGTINLLASDVGKVLSSDSEIDNEGDDVNVNIPKTSHGNN